jgi:hypothetical protein
MQLSGEWQLLNNREHRHLVFFTDFEIRNLKFTLKTEKREIIFKFILWKLIEKMRGG